MVPSAALGVQTLMLHKWTIIYEEPHFVDIMEIYFKPVAGTTVGVLHDLHCRNWAPGHVYEYISGPRALSLFVKTSFV